MEPNLDRMLETRGHIISERLPYHLSSPTISLPQYLGEQTLALGQAMSTKCRVYLDANYWINMRMELQKQTGVYFDLYTGLARQVSLGKAVCPISQYIFGELFKQKDMRTRSATAQLIDELSGGVVFQTNEERIATEVVHHFRREAFGEAAVHPLASLVWSKVAYVLGYTCPRNAAFPVEIDLALQKAFHDIMWTFSLSEMIQFLDNFESLSGDWASLSSSLNSGKFGHSDEVTTFDSLYAAEVYGTLDACSDILSDLAGHPAIAPSLSSSAPVPPWAQLAEIIRKALTSNLKSTSFPSVSIMSAIHAGVRWDRQRKYKPNDVDDFGHATAALPYCHLFFTETSLAHLIRTLKLDDRYGTRVASEPADALKLIDEYL